MVLPRPKIDHSPQGWVLTLSLPKCKQPGATEGKGKELLIVCPWSRASYLNRSTLYYHIMPGFLAVAAISFTGDFPN